MKQRKTGGKVRREKSAKQVAVWQALSLTGQILGHIKNVQKSYLRVGQNLAKVRDEKIFETLGHASMADYAHKRLNLSESSLYRYLRIYDWVLKNKPEWMQKGYKGRIPELADMAVAMRTDEQLAQNPRMAERKRKGLENLKQRALAGNLAKTEAEKAIRKNSKASNPLAEFAAKIRGLRQRGARIAGMPPEALSHLDSAAALLTTEHKLAQAGLHLIAESEVAVA